MTPRIQSILAGILALASALGTAEAAGIIDLLAKQNTQLALLAGILLPLLAAVVHFAKAAQEDLADDGLLNGSTRGTKPTLPPDRFRHVLIPALALLCLGLNSCSGIVSGLTGTPPEPVAVKREGGEPVNIAKRDLILAETGPPATIYGLYDIGQIAHLTGRAVDLGK